VQDVLMTTTLSLAGCAERPGAEEATGRSARLLRLVVVLVRRRWRRRGRVGHAVDVERRERRRRRGVGHAVDRRERHLPGVGGWRRRRGVCYAVDGREWEASAAAAGRGWWTVLVPWRRRCSWGRRVVAWCRWRTRCAGSRRRER
jgi:hypothetical protein